MLVSHDLSLCGDDLPEGGVYPAFMLNVVQWTHMDAFTCLSQAVRLPLSEEDRRRATTIVFQHPFKVVAVFFQPTFQQCNATGDEAVMHFRYTSDTKKSLPALVSPVTLPNKVAKLLPYASCREIS